MSRYLVTAEKSRIFCVRALMSTTDSLLLQGCSEISRNLLQLFGLHEGVPAILIGAIVTIVVSLLTQSSAAKANQPDIKA